MGKLIVMEGACDGIGKTTQYELLKEHLINDGEKVISHHFPSYNTPQGALVEKYLNGDFGEPSKDSAYYIASLYAVDRAVTWNSKLKAQYDNGEIVLLDRYTTSTLIYQSSMIDDIDKKKEFIDFVIEHEYNKIGIKRPDKVIFLTAPFDLVTKLREGRKENEGLDNDIHESNKEFMKKVYDNALFVANYLSWNIVECNNGNEMKSKNDIHEEIYKLIMK